jgi:hypothetical protein
MDNIISKINNNPGYSTDLVLSNHDLENIKKFIQNDYLSILNNLGITSFDSRINSEIENYHHISHLIDHNTAWSKLSRCLSQFNVEIIKRSDFFDTIRSIFGPVSISKLTFGNDYDLSREEIYWRLVRPNFPEDVGALHADSWFHAALNSYGKAIPENSRTIKVWIPIFCEPGNNGLLVVDNSHHRDWSYDIVVSNNMGYPRLNEKVNPKLLLTPPGRAIIFGDKLLHGGAINLGSTTRVSVEITLILES